jgi:hypothetical protein
MNDCQFLPIGAGALTLSRMSGLDCTCPTVSGRADWCAALCGFAHLPLVSLVPLDEVASMNGCQVCLLGLASRRVTPMGMANSGRALPIVSGCAGRCTALWGFVH